MPSLAVLKGCWRTTGLHKGSFEGLLEASKPVKGSFEGLLEVCVQ